MSRLHIMVIKIYTMIYIQGSKITNPDVYTYNNNNFLQSRRKHQSLNMSFGSFSIVEHIALQEDMYTSSTGVNKKRREKKREN